MQASSIRYNSRRLRIPERGGRFRAASRPSVRSRRGRADPVVTVWPGTRSEHPPFAILTASVSASRPPPVGVEPTSVAQHWVFNPVRPRGPVPIVAGPDHWTGVIGQVGRTWTSGAPFGVPIRPRPNREEVFCCQRLVSTWRGPGAMGKQPPVKATARPIVIGPRRTHCLHPDNSTLTRRKPTSQSFEKLETRNAHCPCIATTVFTVRSMIFRSICRLQCLT